MRDLRATRRIGFATCAIALSLGGVAYGSSSSERNSSGNPQASTSAASSVGYNGPEKNLPHSLKAPTKKAGFHYKVGFMSPIASIVSLQAVINGAKAETTKLGGTFILEDGQLNPNLQATQINQLIAQGVNAMMVYPVNPAALLPGIKAARKAGIKVVMEDTPPIAGQALIPGSSMDVLQGRDAAEYSRARAAAKAQPGGKFATLGLAIPVPLLQYGMARLKYWARKYGMSYDGEIDTTTDTASGAAAAMTSILAKYPDVQVVYCYNDQAAEAAAAVARSSGKSQIKVVGENGEPVAIQQVAAGQLWGTVNDDFTSVGRYMAIGTYDLLTKQNLPLPAQLSVGGAMVTKANASTANPLGTKGPLPPVK